MFDSFSHICSFHTSNALAYNGILNLKPKKYRESYYKKRDNISDDHQLIYKAPMDIYITGCKQVANFSLVSAGGCAIYKYFANMDIIDPTMELELGIGPFMSSGYELAVFAGAFLVFNVTILYACSKYPLRIYRNNNR